MTTKREQIERILKDAGPDGIKLTELAAMVGSSVHGMNATVYDMRNAGLAFPASNCQSGRLRVFASQEWSQAYANMPPPTHQACKRCGVVKLMTDFMAAPSMRSGRESTCRQCRKGTSAEKVKPPSMARRLVDLANKTPGEPITSAEVAELLGVTRSLAAAKLSESIRRGHVHGVQIGRVWFAFATADAARAYPVEALQERAKGATSQHRSAIARSKAAKRDQNTIVKVSGTDAPVKLSKAAIRAPEGEGVITEHTKITRIPSFDYSARFHPEPGFVGVFSRVGIGRDMQTGKGWA